MKGMGGMMKPPMGSMGMMPNLMMMMMTGIMKMLPKMTDYYMTMPGPWRRLRLPVFLAQEGEPNEMQERELIVST
jgi:hypothetical protein